MTRVCVWCRVSTGEQTTANQVAPLLAFAEHRGWDVVHTVEVSASAWTGKQHKALAPVLDMAHRRDIDVLLVWALDRLSREGVIETLTLVNKIELSGVRVVSLQEPWTEQEGPMRQLMLSIFAWVAQQESERKSARVKEGMQRARAEGKQIGAKPRAVPVAQHRRFERFALLVAERKLSKEAAARELKCRKADFIAAYRDWESFRKAEALREPVAA